MSMTAEQRKQISSYANYKARTPVETELLTLLRAIAAEPIAISETDVPELTDLVVQEPETAQSDYHFAGDLNEGKSLRSDT